MLVGNLSYAGAQWLAIVIVAKLSSPSAVGQFTLATAICAPILMLSGMALRSLQANDVAGAHAFGTYLGLRMLTTTAAVVAITGIAVLGGYEASTRHIILAVAGSRAADSLSDIVWGHLQQREQMRTIALSMIVRSILGVVLLTLALVSLDSLFAATAAVALANVVSLAAVDLAALRAGAAESLAPSFVRNRLVALARQAFPLGVVLLLSSLSLNIPRYFLAHYRDEYELGVFSALANVLTAGSMFTIALSQALTPRMARYYLASERVQFVSLLRVILLAATAIGLVGIGLALVYGRPLLRMLYTREYEVYADALLPVMVAGMGNYLLNALGAAAVAAREFRRPVPLQLANVLIVLVGCMVLVPAYGVLGAAWVLVISNVATALSFGVMVRGCTRRMSAP